MALKESERASIELIVMRMTQGGPRRVGQASRAASGLSRSVPMSMRQWWNEKDYVGIIGEKTLFAELSSEETVQLVLSDVRAGR